MGRVGIFSDGEYALVVDKELPGNATYVSHVYGVSTEVYSLTLTPDKRFLISGEYESLKLYDLSKERPEVKYLKDRPSSEVRFYINADGGVACSASTIDRSLYLYDTSTWENVAVIDVFREERCGIEACGISPDGKIIFVGSGSGYIAVIDVESRTVKYKGRGPRVSIADIEFHPSGKFVVIGASDRIGVLRDDFRTPAGIYQLDGCITRMTLSNDGNLIAAATENEANETNEIYIFRWGDTKPLRVLKGHEKGIEGKINHIAFNDDGTLLVSSSFDDTVRTWKVATGECISTVDCKGLVFASVFGPDPYYLIIATKKLLFWQRGGKVLRRYKWSGFYEFKEKEGVFTVNGDGITPFYYVFDRPFVGVYDKCEGEKKTEFILEPVEIDVEMPKEDYTLRLGKVKESLKEGDLVHTGPGVGVIYRGKKGELIVIADKKRKYKVGKRANVISSKWNGIWGICELLEKRGILAVLVIRYF